MYAYKIASLARDVEASIGDEPRLRMIAATLQGYAAALRDQERAAVPRELRSLDGGRIVSLEERRAVR